jgi:hypothetical protein
MALQPGSWAIDKAATGGAVTTDQRGASRGDSPDMGAFELGPLPFTNVAASGNTLVAGKMASITWTNPADLGSSDTVDVAYSLDGGQTYTAIVSAAPASGAVGWNVPLATTYQAMIRVSATGQAQQEGFSAPFAILRFDQVLQIATDGDLQALASAINALSPQSPAVRLQVTLAAGTYSDVALHPPAGVTVVLRGSGKNTIIVGHSPALTVTGGQVEVDDLTLTTDTDSPTVMVTDGTLTMRGDEIDETPGFDDPAVKVTGGMVDLGTANDPGNNQLDGQGEFLWAADPAEIAAVGDTFDVGGKEQTGSTPTSTSVTISTTSTAFGAGVVLTASVMPWSGGTPSGNVDFFDVALNKDLGTAPLNAVQGVAQAVLPTVYLSAGSNEIRATYLGDGAFLPSAGVVTATSGGQGNDQAYVNALYLHLLGRPADATGQTFWAGLLATGSTRQQISADILNSDEGRIEQIDQLYQTDLGRSGDEAGVEAHLAYLKAGGSLEGLQTIFLTSPEFVTLSGGAPVLYVDALYRTLLGRSSTGDQGASPFVQLILEGGDKASVVTDLLMSAEGNRTLASQLYASILERSAGSDELSFWTTALQQSSRPEETAITSFLASDEFFNRS